MSRVGARGTGEGWRMYEGGESRYKTNLRHLVSRIHKNKKRYES